MCRGNELINILSSQVWLEQAFRKRFAQTHFGSSYQKLMAALILPQIAVLVFGA